MKVVSKNASVKTAEPIIYELGKMKHDRFWIQCPDGRMLQLDTDSKEVLIRLANKQSIQSVSKDLGVEEDAIRMLLNLLGLEPDSNFYLKCDQSIQASDKAKDNFFFNPWIEHRWFTWGIAVAIVVSLIFLFLFVKNVPPLFVSGLKELWIIVGFLTFSVLCHEIGHLLTMPRHRNISIFIQWSGPLPMLSIICNEAWKLTKWQRMRINIAGFAADLILCGVAAALGLFLNFLAPWIWTFLFIHMIRMIFAIWPLLPGDGYWVLVDLFEQPNLWANGIKHVKQLKLSWLSFYAIARMLFLLLIWLLYAYVIYYWSILIAARPVEEAVHLLLHPAPLLISLTLLSQLYLVVSNGVKQLRRAGSYFLKLAKRAAP